MIATANRSLPVASLQNLFHLFWNQESVYRGLAPLPDQGHCEGKISRRLSPLKQEAQE